MIHAVLTIEHQIIMVDAKKIFKGAKFKIGITWTN